MDTILYTKDFDEIVNKPVNVILSPQYYWIKKIEIPIRSFHQAKRIARNMFDLEGDYIFGAIKVDNKFFAYAIKKNLDLKIDKKYIKSLYLAQSELYEYDCINVGNHSIKKIEDILFCFPKDKNCKSLDLSNIKLSKNAVVLDTINLQTSSVVMIAAFFLIFNIVFLTQGFIYKNTVSDIENKKIALTKKYNLPSTSFQLNAIYNTLKIKYQKIKLLKKDLEFFSKTPLSKNDKFIKLSFDSNFYDIIVQINKNLDFYFKKRFNVISTFANKKYKAKLSHE